MPACTSTQDVLELVNLQYSFIVENLNYFISLLINRIDTYYDNFGVFYNNTLSYLFTNPERDVVKQNIDNPEQISL